MITLIHKVTEQLVEIEADCKDWFFSQVSDPDQWVVPESVTDAEPAKVAEPETADAEPLGAFHGAESDYAAGADPTIDADTIHSELTGAGNA